MEEDVIKRIREHIETNEESITFPLASEDVVRDAEASLGLRIPAILRQIYLTISSGGFGPGYGIIGVDGGRASNLGTLISAYAQMKNGADYLGLEWKTSLVPFCEWGCNIFSCVDCDDPEHRVFQSEDCDVQAQNYTLEEFFDMWLNGVEILNMGNSRKKTAEIINPFTGKKARVSGMRKKTK